LLDYFAIDVLILIALLAAAKLFPPTAVYVASISTASVCDTLQARHSKT